mgnify:CR=1 FL=1
MFRMLDPSTIWPSSGPGAARLFDQATSRIPSEALITLVVVVLTLLLVVAARRFSRFGPWPFTVALFGVMFLSGALYLFLGPGGPYLLPLLALLVVLILGFGLGLLPQVLAGRAGVPEGEDGGTLAPSGWGRAVRVMQYDVLAALALLWLSDRVGFLGIASLAIGAANVMVLAAYAAMSWRERHALPIDRFGSWYYLAVASCLIIGVGLLGIVRL